MIQCNEKLLVKGGAPILRIYEYGTDNIPSAPCALAIGLFDGVHKAHRELIKRAADDAKKRNLPLGVFTFSSESAIKSGTKRIYTTEQRLGILSELGVDFCVISDFSKVCNMSADQFCRNTLYNDLGCRLACVGYNFKFGFGASADTSDLTRIMASLGAEAVICERLTQNGAEISSSAIRRLLELGDIETAGELLGEPYFAKGYVTHGRGIGRDRLGVPTINVAFGSDSLIPRLGVYTASAVIGSAEHPAIVNIGTCPTLGERKVHIEAHLLDFKGDLYGQFVRINFLSFLRDEKVFSNEEELKMQINADITAAIEKNRGVK